MDRTIKFRAWDLEKREWINETGTTFTSSAATEGQVALSLSGHLRVFKADCSICPDGEHLISVGNSEYESEHPYSTEPRYRRQYALQQFTGLSDRNGKDVYEGDIVRHHKYGGEHAVAWLSESTGFFVGEESWPLTKLCTQHIEVVGNVFETKESSALEGAED